MSKVQHLRSPDKRIASAERAELAAAIADRDEAQRVAESAHTAVQRAREMVDQAQAKLETAKSGVAAARSSQAKRLLSSAQTGAPATTDASTRAARARETDAEDELEAARSASASVEKSLSEAEHALRRAEECVEAAAEDVVRAESIAPILAEAKALQAALDRINSVLFYLKIRCLRDDTPLKEDIADYMASPICSTVRSLAGNTYEVCQRRLEEIPEIQSWNRALEALGRDPEAPLPEH